MATIEPFATLDDYVAMYGEPSLSDRARLSSLLLRATGYLLGHLEDYAKGENEVLDLNLSSVCCAMVHRALSAPKDMEGVSQYSQTAGVYTTSVSLRDVYMRPLPSELDLLGLDSQTVITSVRMTGANYDAD